MLKNAAEKARDDVSVEIGDFVQAVRGRLLYSLTDLKQKTTNAHGGVCD